MAKLIEGILGGFSGRVGTVVGYCRGGRWYVRAYQPVIKDKRSQAQLAQRGLFKAMIGLASRLTPAIRLGMKAMSDREVLTGGNCFLRLNSGCFGYDAEGGIAVDYRRLQLSEGTAPTVACLGASVEGGVARVRFAKNTRLRGAQVQLVAFDEVSQRCCMAEAVDVASGEAAVALPDGWHAEATHLYLFTMTRDGRCSATQYVEPEGADNQSGKAVAEGVEGGGAGAPRSGAPAPTRTPRQPSASRRPDE